MNIGDILYEQDSENNAITNKLYFVIKVSEKCAWIQDFPRISVPIRRKIYYRKKHPYVKWNQHTILSKNSPKHTNFFGHQPILFLVTIK